MKSPSSPTNKQPLGVALVALGASLWGLDTVLRQPLTHSISSSTIVFLEHLILSLVLLPVVWRLRGEWLPLQSGQWAAVVWIAWGGSALGTVCFTQSVKLGNPTSAVFLQKLQPLVAVALARWWLRETEPLRRRFWARLAVALAAAYLISFGDGLSWTAVLDARAASSLLAVAAAAIWGSCTVFGRYVLPALSVPALTALRIVGALPLLCVMAAVGDDPQTRLSLLQWEEWRALLLMALIPGLAGLLIYYRGLSRTPASLATLAELCFPASAALVNWAFLGTEIAALQAAGMIMLCAAVLWKAEDKPPSGSASRQTSSRQDRLSAFVSRTG